MDSQATSERQFPTVAEIVPNSTRLGEVGNFEGEVETAMKKRVAVEKERVSILNEQTKCSRSI